MGRHSAPPSRRPIVVLAGATAVLASGAFATSVVDGSDGMLPAAARPVSAASWATEAASPGPTRSAGTDRSSRSTDRGALTGGTAGTATTAAPEPTATTATVDPAPTQAAVRQNTPSPSATPTDAAPPGGAGTSTPAPSPSPTSTADSGDSLLDVITDTITDLLP